MSAFGWPRCRKEPGRRRWIPSFEIRNRCKSSWRTLSSKSNESDDDSRKIFTDIEKLLVQCLGYSRSFIGELSPTALLPDTLPVVLRRLADRMRDQGLIVTVHDGEDDLSVYHDVSMVIYQTVNELLCNVLKHAHTSSAVISLAGSCEGVLTVTVRDQGIGFGTGGLGDRCLEQRKFGLFSIREQLTAVGGELSIESAIGAGTLATVVIPSHGIPHPSTGMQSTGGVI